jgi:hypothetical protein
LVAPVYIRKVASAVDEARSLALLLWFEVRVCYGQLVELQYSEGIADVHLVIEVFLELVDLPVQTAFLPPPLNHQLLKMSSMSFDEYFNKMVSDEGKFEMFCTQHLDHIKRGYVRSQAEKSSRKHSRRYWRRWSRARPHL